jgi:hypothetical protein
MGKREGGAYEEPYHLAMEAPTTSHAPELRRPPLHPPL